MTTSALTLPDLTPFRSQIEAALSYADGTHDVDDVVDMVERGTAQFWPGVTSCLVTEIIEYPKCKVLNVWLAGGKLPELEAMIPLVLEWGRERGCSHATFTGRKGWARTFVRRMGWRVSDLVRMETPL